MDKMKPNPIREVLDPPEDSDSLNPEPENLFENTTIKMDILKTLAYQNILSVDDLSHPAVVEICKLAAVLESMEITPYRPLAGRIAITAFFEASTRTRTSFESAVLRLDGRVISIPDGQVTGTKKGESIEDIGEMFNAYGDLVIMRHTETDAPERLLKNLRIPLINAGNGSGEHPTQALADWYALLKWNPKLARKKPIKHPLHLGIMGTPGSMRAVKSFLRMALLFKQHIGKITIISEMADPFGDIAPEIEHSDIKCEVANDLQAHLPEIDVLYMNSIAFLGDSYKALDSRFKLDSDSPLKKDSVILHPLARLEELDTSLDNTPHNLYWKQAHGAVFIRQALLAAVMGRCSHLPENIPFDHRH